MNAPLTDPWFEASFYGRVAPDGRSWRSALVFAEAQGLWLWCPCGYGKPEWADLTGPRPHGLIIPFANGPGGALPDDHGPISRDGRTHPRWTMSGTGLADLTITPSVLVGTPEVSECWHGFITSGRVT